ncbi:hypothetical protein, conserved [Trypanosoma brucei gambiense DAL972]|nr:hypothetical protein, conserved [Trypanosoma brucei gambiense DAL972]CBH11450.1 hypothetical protein, conserved [Trypanosoma brucei gambiense DAL972]|eukprot:XP_011773737.1 hypothetical protein, conserved [Trypanosoma brucei gambiense DAL972]
MREVLPQGRVNDRDNELTVFLQQLPARCDKAKQDLLQAQRASKYYRTRYGRGLEMRRRQYQQLLNLSDAELQMWARSRLRPVRNPMKPC